MRLTQAYALISLILLLSLTFSQDLTSLNSNTCPDQLTETFLQSGSNVLNNPKTSNQRSLSFQVNVNYNIPSSQGLNVAISTGLISGYNQGLGTDYSIRAVRVNQTNTVKIFLYINSDRSWTSIKASYLISSRPDFFLGSFVTQSFDLLKSSGDSYLVENSLANWSFTNRNMKYIYLISGIKTSDTLFNINLVESNFNNQNGKITLRVTSNAIPAIELLYITYVIFEEQAPFTLQSYNPLLKIFRNFDYTLEGVDSINGNTVVNEAFGLVSTQPKILMLNCLGSGCSTNCISNNDCLFNKGVVVQRNCFICGSNQFYSNGQCLPICRQNQFISNNICLCKTGFSIVNGVCKPLPITCRQNEFFNGFQCVCISGYKIINGFCQLSSTLCPANSFNNGLECVCVSGFVKIGSRCASICNQNGYISQSGSCVCLDGFTFVNGICQRLVVCTQANEINVNNRCQCRLGYEYNNFGNCAIINTCRSNEQFVNGACICQNGFTKNSFGVCVQIQCSSNEILSNGNCVCFPGFQRNSQGFCVKTCGQNQFLSNNNQCLCLTGFVNNSFGICVPISCGVNQVLNNNICECRAGYIRVSNNNCVLLVAQCRINQIYDQNIKSCVCRQGYGLNPSTGLCSVCPANSRSSGLLTGCLCNNGYTWSSSLQQCINLVCSNNFILNSNGVCVCGNGFYLENGQCKQIPTCPSRSTWSQAKLLCVCDSSSQNLINGQCQGCQVNSGWNGTQCVCKSEFFLINGVCTQCSSNSDYVRGNCVCKFSYFGNGISCSPCHSTCGTCSNQLSNSCLSCANASYTLTNGVCTLGLCDKGNFFNNAIARCQKCPEFCDSCTSAFTCDKCISGFNKQSKFTEGRQFDSCLQTCGDGKRFYLQCDDGNTINGDGCNSNCQVQKGWTCVGGSSSSKSSCSNTIPTSSKIIIGGHVILQGQVLQGVSMTYLPPSLTNNGCPQCGNVFNVSIISSPVIPSITVGYVQATQYRYYIRFNFGGSLANFAFSYSIRINENFRQFFTTQDMEQIQTVKIDTALLSKVEKVDSLTFDDDSITIPSINGFGAIINQTISIDGVPSNAIKILFPQ